MYKIGLTGGIASGKTTVSRILRELGAFVIDADKIARQVVQPGLPAWEKIVSHFGRKVLNADNSLDRRQIADIVFASLTQRTYLEEITHPAIYQQVEVQMELAATLGHRLVVLDVPLLLESNWDTKVDVVWVVYANFETQINRLMARDTLTREKAQQRISSQLNLEEKIRRADLVIDNSGSPQTTRQQVETALSEVFRQTTKKFI